VTWFGVPASAFAITYGEASLRWYHSTPDAERAHCERCGTALLFRSPRWADEQHVTLASLDAPLDRAPAGHVYWNDHVPWVAVTDDLPRFATLPREGAPLPRGA
jgi:hypothetical protein